VLIVVCGVLVCCCVMLYVCLRFFYAEYFVCA